MNKMPVDEACFDALDDTRAWLLGWLFADCTLRIKDGYHSLSIETTDELVLRVFISTLKVSQSVRMRQRNNGKPTLSVDIYGLRKLGPKLESIGLRIGKENRVPPDIPYIYVRPFIRGYFDGDGCVISRPLAKANRLQSNIKGPPKLLLWIEKELASEGITGSHHQEEKSFRLDYKIGASTNLYRYMYYDDCMCLERKKVRFEEFITRGGDSLCPVGTRGES